MKTAELKGALLDYWVAKHSAQCTGLQIEWRGDHWVGTGEIDGKVEVVVAGASKGVRGAIQMRRLYGREVIVYQPSTSWADGGPIIEVERITLLRYRSDSIGWVAYVDCNFEGSDDSPCGWKAEGQAQAPLVAAMRAFVSSKFGGEFGSEVPDL